MTQYKTKPHFKSRIHILSILSFFSLLLTGCFLPSQVDEEYCKSNQNLIECLGGDLVWNEATQKCNCVCNEGRWGDRCQYEADRCKGQIDGNGNCSCQSLPECDSEIFYSRYNYFCECTDTFNDDNDDDEWIDFRNFDRPVHPTKNLNSNNRDYFPLQIGQAWFYNILDSSGVTTSEWAMSVRDTFTVSDTLYFDIRMALPDSLGKLVAVLGPLLFNLPDDPDQVHIRYNESQSDLFSYHEFPGPGSYVIDGDTTIIESLGQITVPAGSFDSCIAITYPAEASSLIYAPDAGLIKVISEGLDNMVLTYLQQACTLSASVSIEPITCGGTNDGEISLTVEGANGPLYYNWSGATNIGSVPSANGLLAGSYSVTISDDICSIVIPTIVIEDSPTSLSISSVIQHIICSGDSSGAIDITVSGSNGSLTFNWDNGQYDTEDIANLTAGSYHLMVTDSMGCSATGSFIIQESEPISVDLINSMPVSCKGERNGSLEIAISGGTEPYYVDWNDGLFSGKAISGLTEGTYHLFVSDANGCTVTETYEIEFRPSLIPRSLNIQGLLSDTTGHPLPDDLYDLSFRLYSTIFGDSVLWSEDQLGIPVASGIFSTVLGYTSPMDLCFDQAYFLGISVNNGNEMTPRIELTSTPYSFMARNVDDGAITTPKIKDMAVTPEKISVDILSGINGIRNDGGDISIEAGENILIATDFTDHTITISALEFGQDSSISVDQVEPDIVSSINDVVNDGGNIDFLAGNNISITPDDSTNTITISAMGTSGPDSVTLDHIVPDVVSSISGVTNDGGDIGLVAGDNITISTDNVNNTITIAASDPDIGIPVDQLWQEQDEGISYTGQNVRLLRENTSIAAQMSNLFDGTGYVSTSGPNGYFNTRLSSVFEKPNQGLISVHNSEGLTKAAIYASSGENGVIYTNGANGYTNTALTFFSDYPNHGFIAAYDDEGFPRAIMYVDGDGNGRVYADAYDTFTDHPTKSNVQLRNSLLRGSEEGIYLRGTSTLVDGKAYVEYPEYFQHQISNENMTVMITPLSAQSKGIAVIKKKITGFDVQELLEGRGNYSFDWEVKAIRKGTENYEVYKNKEKVVPAFEKSNN